MGGVSQRAPTVASASHKRFLVRPRRHSASLLTTMRRHADPDGPPERSLGIPRSFLAREKNTSFGASCPDMHADMVILNLYIQAIPILLLLSPPFYLFPS